MASSTSASAPLSAQISSFVAHHQRAIVLSSVAVIAAGGVGYYLYTSSSAQAKVKAVKEQAKAKADEKEEEWEDVHEQEPAATGAKKHKKKKNKKKAGESADKPKETVQVEDEDGLGPRPTEEEIKAMPIDERAAMAASLKQKGNASYQSRNFSYAVELYTRAIAVSPTPEAVFYSNRAACYVNYSPPQHQKVIDDCNEALKLDKNYVKALNRRAGAHEALGNDIDALHDFTAATILDRFKNETSAQAMERVLKKVANKRMVEILSTREPRLPSMTFISSYLAAFRPHLKPALPENPSSGDKALDLAFDALEAADYQHAFTLANEAVEQAPSTPRGNAEALNLRGTFKFILGEATAARADMLASIDADATLTQTWVKIASVHMELNDSDAAFAAFDKALEYNKDDPDIYYHRGQVHFIMGNYDSASEDYEKSVALDPNFVFTHIQLAVAKYKQGNIPQSMAKFRTAMRQFPQSSEPQNYYGELLLDQQRFQDAVEKFDRAIELERQKPRRRMNVLPLVNKALTIYQWKQDTNAAEALCREALEIDPECDAAVGTLAQFSLQMGKLETAIEMFKKGADIARTAPDLENALTYQYATQAQMQFVKEYPEMATQLGQLARSLAG
ncbi:mitochondrial outer membrane translocase receptor TOM70 [Calocera viscosa TUFC12733]|uniref:Mitochondrial outer membrane translocase receptor TOM70 n=1 Tax=Calocera viscosa (strain TUFC12733) TaxID=1330018 RepID=A0A167N2E6_CALVF|nr:mitochondrial outer membrane translocase receptor TOM70 [Calocera viscosa TUFC12733]